MSYVQGTSVRLQADFADPITRAAVVPSEITLLIRRPDGTTFEVTRSGGGILPDPDRAGRFYYVLDTSSQFGTWQYQFDGVGAVERAVERKSITVTKRLVPAAA